VGSGFQTGATMKLVCSGQPDILATNVSLPSDGRTISGTFALTWSATETCDVVVTNPDGGTATDAQAFMVQAGGSPNMWVDIVGLPNMHGGSSQSYYVVYGNRGNVDATGIVVSVEVQSSVMWTLLNDQIPIFEQLQPHGALLRAFAASVIPPQSSSATVVNITAPAVEAVGVDVSLPFQLRAWIGAR
jgi:hypothetical protein